MTICGPCIALQSAELVDILFPYQQRSGQQQLSIFDCSSANTLQQTFTQAINQRLQTYLRYYQLAHNMASTTGTMRGTPNRGQSGQGRGTVPAFTNSPASNIPRPAFESHASTTSDAGGSTMSASRQRQSNRDEVCWECH